MKAQAILIFDREEAVRDSLYIVLSEEGYRCYSVRDAAEVLQPLLDESINVLILDSQVHHLTSLLKRIKIASPTTKIILLSDYAEAEVTQQALMQGADDFILKPLDFDELILHVEKLLLPAAR
jgi:DNA-binding response OmpR family regulator